MVITKQVCKLSENNFNGSPLFPCIPTSGAKNPDGPVLMTIEVD